MNTLTYNGYIGTVNFSEKEDVFFGKIEGIELEKIELNIDL